MKFSIGTPVAPTVIARGAPEVSVRRLPDGSSEAVPDREWPDAVAAGVDGAVARLPSDCSDPPDTPPNRGCGYADADTSLRYERIASLVGAPAPLVAPIVDRIRRGRGRAAE